MVMNNNEKIAMIHDGIEGTGKHFVMSDSQKSDFNDSVDKVVNKFDTYNQALNEYVEHISENMNGLEILPMFGYALIKPFSINPFQQIKVDSSSGIILDMGGMTPEYKSNETGEIEESEQYIKVGEVVETGFKCEFLKPGDVVFYTVASENPIPFFKQGFVVVAEQRIMAVVNSGLTQRRDAARVL